MASGTAGTGLINALSTVRQSGSELVDGTGVLPADVIPGLAGPSAAFRRRELMAITGRRPSGEPGELR